MLNKNDFKYILKRVITFLIIGTIICLLGSCKAKADSFKPIQASLCFTNNSCLTNTNVNTTFQLDNGTQNFNMWKLIDGQVISNNINYLNPKMMTGQPFSEPDTYYKFSLSLSGANLFNGQGEPNIIFDTVQINNRVNGTWSNCYNIGKVHHYNSEHPIDSFIYYTYQCHSENSDGWLVKTKKRDSNDSNVYTMDLTWGFSIDSLYGTDVDNLWESQITAMNTERMAELMDSVDVNDNLYSVNYGILTNNYNIQSNVITQLITLPITLLQAYSSAWNGTCQRIDLGSLLGTHLYLPCIEPQRYLGATLWLTIDCLMSGFLILSIAKKFINVFDDLTNLRTNQVDELYGGGA